MRRRYFGWLCGGLLSAALTTPGWAAADSGAIWHAVLVAGDYAEPVFDNAVTMFQRRLTAFGVPSDKIHRFSARPNPNDPGLAPARAERILERIASLPARPGERCLVFITSHGERGKGAWLAYGEEFLPPAALARALDGGCARVPTVVIVSACYSGGFVNGPMAAPNRIILTAARPDRPSFGCQVDRTYAVFDECLLGVLPRSATWWAVAADAGDCVRHREHELRALPSQPQKYFGAAVRKLSVR